jgi:hypothetical protein
MSRYYLPENGGFYHEDHHIPPDSIKITDEEYIKAINGYSAGKAVKYNGDGTFTVTDKVMPIEVIAHTCSSEIEKYILSKIKPLPYNYDNVEQLGQWASNPNTEYQQEAMTLYSWAIQCQVIAFNILSLKVTCANKDEVIAMLPPFPFS